MTVGELKNRITPHEVQGWMLYEKEYGPLHLGLRIERAIAQVFAPFFKDKAGKQLTMRDLMTWPLSKPEEEYAKPEDIMKLLGAVVKTKGKKNG
jgi:hypothetical protein